jgi:hypothetical protein
MGGLGHITISKNGKKQHLTKENIIKINEFKKFMNLFRTSVCWGHLNLW